MQIRNFNEADYPALAQLYRAVYPGSPRSEAELRYLDGRFTPPYLHRRWLAETGGRLLGWGEYAQHAASYQPQHFAIEVAALPEAEAVKGVLYHELLSGLGPHEPTEFKTEVEEAHAEFFLGRGFTEVKRNWTLELDLSTFDPSPYLERSGALGAAGYSFSPFAELEATEAGTRALYELLRELVTQVPSATPRQPWSFEQFLAHRSSSPSLFPEGSLVVRRGEALIGVSELKRTSAADTLTTSLTAVRAAFRGQGLALAAKVKTLLRAKRLGFERVTTQNASSNLKMVALNEKLGFQKTRTLIELAKNL